MFQINDIVTYGTNGVCKIENITMKEFMGSAKEYYVLKPVNDNASTIYVPVHNEKVAGKMRKNVQTEAVGMFIKMAVA